MDTNNLTHTSQNSENISYEYAGKSTNDAVSKTAKGE
jgi:hypothetical protein